MRRSAGVALALLAAGGAHLGAPGAGTPSASCADAIPATALRPGVAYLTSTCADFVSEAKRVLPQVRFAPARIGGCPAAQLVQQPFTFALRD